MGGLNRWQPDSAGLLQRYFTFIKQSASITFSTPHLSTKERFAVYGNEASYIQKFPTLKFLSHLWPWRSLTQRRLRYEVSFNSWSLWDIKWQKTCLCGNIVKLGGGTLHMLCVGQMTVSSGQNGPWVDDNKICFFSHRLFNGEGQ